MPDVKIGDYIRISGSTVIDLVIDMPGHDIYTAEYFLDNSDMGFIRREYKSNIEASVVVLSADNTDDKILIDKFNIAKMQYILEQ